MATKSTTTPLRVLDMVLPPPVTHLVMAWDLSSSSQNRPDHSCPLLVDVGNIISRVAIQSARDGLLSPMHRGVFNLVQRHQAIERDATASFVRSEGVIPADELTAYQTLVDIYYQHPRIFAAMNTVHNEERMNAVQDALTFNAELACANQPNFLAVLPGEIRNEIYRYLLVAEKRLIPWKDGYDLSLSIIATTKKLQIETSSILYGDNTFFLTPGYPERDRSETFFKTIGLFNAGQIRSIRLDFPSLSVTSLPIPAETPVFEQIASATLDIITAICRNIEIVTVTPQEIRIVGQYDSPFAFPRKNSFLPRRKPRPERYWPVVDIFFKRSRILNNPEELDHSIYGEVIPHNDTPLESDGGSLNDRDPHGNAASDNDTPNGNTSSVNNMDPHNATDMENQ
ncbi:unnamed protein product [Penicillium bialowiezense]